MVQRQTETTRNLRREMTGPEVALWQRLRADQLGARFRRQLSVGPYVVDFACPTRKSVVEVDGLTHVNPARDAVRDRHLAGLGWCVLRVTNDAVLENLDGVIATIVSALATDKDPSSPSGRWNDI